MPKTNSQIELIGVIEEVISNIGAARAFTASSEEELRKELLRIQTQLTQILRYLHKDSTERITLGEDAVTELENGIDRFEPYYDGFDPYAIATRCRTAALMEVARTSARRAERIYARADLAVGSRESALHRRYLNRLSDYLWAAARYLDAVRQESPAAASGTARLKELNAVNPMSLSNVKRFMQALEDEAQRRGLQLVIAVCDKEGRPVAVHVMDEAFIASYDIAVNKAFTAVSLKMSTKELAKLCAPGGSLYGLQHTNQGRIVIFGGGVTLRDREGNILGGLGVSGSTAEIDTMMGDVGEELFLRMQSR